MLVCVIVLFCAWICGCVLDDVIWDVIFFGCWVAIYRISASLCSECYGCSGVKRHLLLEIIVSSLDLYGDVGCVCF